MQKAFITFLSLLTVALTLFVEITFANLDITYLPMDYDYPAIAYSDSNQR